MYSLCRNSGHISTGAASTAGAGCGEVCADIQRGDCRMWRRGGRVRMASVKSEYLHSLVTAPSFPYNPQVAVDMRNVTANILQLISY